MTTITRKVYDPEGSEISALGLPCTTVTESFDGSVSSSNGNISIDDAYELEDIEIDDNHSSGILSMIANIAKVQSQDRNIKYDFTVPTVIGYKIDEEGNCNYNEDEVQDSIVEVNLQDKYIDGVPVIKVWKSNGQVSLQSISSSVLSNGKIKDVVYKVLTQAQSSQFSSLLEQGETFCDVNIDVENGIKNSGGNSVKSPQLVAIIPNGNLDKALCLYKFYVGGNDLYDTLFKFVEYGFDYHMIINMYRHDKSIANILTNYTFRLNGKTAAVSGYWIDEKNGARWDVGNCSNDGKSWQVRGESAFMKLNNADKNLYNLGNHFRVTAIVDFSTIGAIMDFGSIAEATKNLSFGVVTNVMKINWKMLGNSSNPGVSVNIPTTKGLHILTWSIIDAGNGKDKFVASFDDTYAETIGIIPNATNFGGYTNWGANDFYIGRGVLAGYGGEFEGKIYDIFFEVID